MHTNSRFPLLVLLLTALVANAAAAAPLTCQDHVVRVHLAPGETEQFRSSQSAIP